MGALEYSSRGSDAPDSLVGKFPAADADSRNFGIEFGIYKKEVNFYKFLQPKARITTPHCYFTEIDEATSEFVLLMSDEAPAAQGDQLEGIDLSQAREKWLTKRPSCIRPSGWIGKSSSLIGSSRRRKCWPSSNRKPCARRPVCS